jgi:catechol 2,3-dioxygenase-like lactoylglutathione lyase family enzyme
MSETTEPMVAGLFHVAVKTNNLPQTVAFYEKILGLRNGFRPNFGFPGAWLYVPVAGGPAILHVYAGGPAMGPDGRAPLQTGAIDHLSLACRGFHGYVARCRTHGLDWREFIVPNTTLWQLFVYDPSGMQCELTFEGAAETGPLPDMSPGRAYVAGSSFFDAARYPSLS